MMTCEDENIFSWQGKGLKLGFGWLWLVM